MRRVGDAAAARDRPGASSTSAPLVALIVAAAAQSLPPIMLAKGLAVAGGGLDYALPLTEDAVKVRRLALSVCVVLLGGERWRRQYLAPGDSNTIEWLLDSCADGGV